MVGKIQDVQVPVLAFLKVSFVSYVDEKALMMIWQNLNDNNLKSRVVENVKLIHFREKCECFRARMEVKAHIAINIDKSHSVGLKSETFKLPAEVWL